MPGLDADLETVPSCVGSGGRLRPRNTTPLPAFILFCELLPPSAPATGEKSAPAPTSLSPGFAVVYANGM